MILKEKKQGNQIYSIIYKRGAKMKNIEYLLLGILTLLIMAFLGFEVVLLIIYGNKPITEVPMWVLWFLGKGN